MKFIYSRTENKFLTMINSSRKYHHILAFLMDPVNRNAAIDHHNMLSQDPIPKKPSVSEFLEKAPHPPTSCTSKEVSNN